MLVFIMRESCEIMCHFLCVGAVFFFVVIMSGAGFYYEGVFRHVTPARDDTFKYVVSEKRCGRVFHVCSQRFIYVCLEF